VSKVRYGIVGCGGAAVDVAKALDEMEDVRLVAVLDASRERAEALGAPRNARVHATLDELLADTELDVVYIALPHDLLAPTTLAALRAGRDVLVEKPAATKSADAAELARTAKSLSRVLGVMFEFRAAPPIVEARKILAGRHLGPVLGVRISTVIDKPGDYWRSGPTGLVVDSWRASRARAGGGVVLMNSIHQLDAVRFMTGCGFARAAGEIASYTPDIEVEDAAGAVLRLTNDAICTLTAAAHSHGARGQETISIDCANGRIDLPDPYGTGRLRVFAPDSSGAADWRDTSAAAAQSHGAYLREFTDAVRRREQAVATAWDAAAALAAVEAIYESARTGRTVEVASYSD